MPKAPDLSEICNDLRGTISAKLDPLIEFGEDYAFLDFPEYSNVGDSLIWLGALNYLVTRTGKLPSYVCTIWDFEPAELKRRVPNGTIFLTGGGNFGNLWPQFQNFRLKVLSELPGRKVVQLPQTLHFSDVEAASVTRRAIEDHGRFTLLVRDRPSLEFASANLGVQAISCPDMAFSLGPVTRTAPPTHDVAMMLRTDKEQNEARGAFISNDGLSIREFDWIKESRSYHHYLDKAGNRLERQFGFPRKVAMYKHRAERRLKRGQELLQSGKVVVTDRLHGFIFSILLGIDHAVIDNSYGKLRNFHDLWIPATSRSSFCRSVPEAIGWAKERIQGL